MAGSRIGMTAVLLMVLALLLAACGGDGEDTAAEDTAEEETAEDTEAGDTEAATEDTEGGEAAAGDLGLQEEGVISVGSDIAFAPFEFVEDGENRGFDIDLMDEIASRLGVEAEFVNTGFDTLLTQVASGQFDVGMSAITITEERQETVSFSDPYFQANQAIAAPAESDVASEEDLAEVRVAVQAATTGFEYASENFTESEIVEFPTSEAAFTALGAGQVDAVFIDTPVAEEAAATNDAIEVKGTVDTGEEYGIAVPLENEALLESINGALEEIIADGTYEEVYGTWFETEVPEAFAAER